jgi:hypothetical protein
MKKINVFYHIYLTDNVELIVEDQLNKLNSLKKKYNIEFFININHNINTIKKYDELNTKLNNLTNNITFCEHNIYELSTLNLLQKHAFENNDNYYLYIHTKGASRLKLNTENSIDYSYYENNYSYKNVENWRHIMEHFCVEQSDTCLKELETNDLVGCNYIPSGTMNVPTHFSGNFWWSKSEYIKKLPSIENYISNKNYIDRFYAEFWVGFIPHKAVCLYPIPKPIFEKHNRCFSFTPENEFYKKITKQYFTN